RPEPRLHGRTCHHRCRPDRGQTDGTTLSDRKAGGKTRPSLPRNGGFGRGDDRDNGSCSLGVAALAISAPRQRIALQHLHPEDLSMFAWLLVASLAVCAEPLEDGSLIVLENCSSVVQRATRGS